MGIDVESTVFGARGDGSRDSAATEASAVMRMRVSTARSVRPAGRPPDLMTPFPPL